MFINILMAWKILIGVVFLLAGLWLLLPLQGILGPQPFLGIGWDKFKIVLLGSIPAFLALLGLLIIWIELEEFKK